MVLVTAFCSIVFFTVVTSILKTSWQRDISSILGSLRTCDSLRVRNSFYDRGSASAIPVVEDIVVKNPQTIRELTDILRNIRYKRFSTPSSPTRLGTEEMIDVYIYENSVQVDWFRIIGGCALEIDKGTKLLRYRSSDEDLITRLRETVGARGDWLGTRY
jgi:hypothetical protein